MADKIATLRKTSIFSTLDDSYLPEIADIATEKKYRKNSVIFQKGDEGRSLFILKAGTAKIFLTDSDGKEIILRMIHENEFFGEMSLLDGNFRSATVSTIEPCIALVILRKDFVKFLEKHPDTVFEIVAALSRRLRSSDDKISNLVFLNSYGKVASVLLDLANTIGSTEGTSQVLNLPISRQELASMAGITRETFVRILNEFQSRGCIRVEGKKIFILDEKIISRELSV
ncbi:MAG: Crp/Fnr family transcriptional regulator [Nitrospinota bacterium]